MNLLVLYMKVWAGHTPQRALSRNLVFQDGKKVKTDDRIAMEPAATRRVYEDYIYEVW